MSTRRKAECSSCRAPIFWATTWHGNRIPVDFEPVENGNLELTVSDDPAVPPIAFVLDKDELPLTPTRYVSHFATCPNAAAHRKVAS